MAENTNGITEAIIVKANDDAARIMSVAEQYGQAKQAEAQSVADGVLACAREEAAKACAFIAERGESNSRIERKKALTQAKTEIVDEVFDKAKAMLFALDESKTLQFISVLLEKNVEKGDKLVLSQRHAALADKIAALPVVKNNDVTLAVGDFDGGFRLFGEKSDKDCSFDAIIAFGAENLRAYAAKKLFDSEGNE